MTPSKTASAAKTLPVIIRWCQYETVGAGTLNQWLGPALRGIMLKPLRDRLCLLSQTQQSEKSSLAKGNENAYCRGCELNAECIYGRCLEPDLLVQRGEVVRGVRDGLRAITIAAGMLDAPSAPAGTLLQVRWLGIGNDAEVMLNLACEEFDRELGRVGLGPDHVRCASRAESCVDQQLSLQASDLPIQASAARVPQVTFHFDSPLMLKTRQKSRGPRRFNRNDQAAPSFESLLAESVRSVRRALGEYADPSWDRSIHLGDFVKPDSPIACVDSQLQVFQQNRTSARQQTKWEVSGWVGSATYQNVPVAYLPWLAWAGRLGVGDSRNCGAGLWSLVV